MRPIRSSSISARACSEQTDLPTPFPPPPDFSIVLGGPLFQLLRRTHLVRRYPGAGASPRDRRNRDHLGAAAVLSLLDGAAWWGRVAVPFLVNAEVQARFLLAMPLLIVAELGVHLRMRQLVAAVFQPRPGRRRRIGRASAPRLNRRCGCGTRSPSELTLIVLIYAVGIPMREYLAVDASTWAVGIDGSARDSSTCRMAGWWHALVSVPVFQFLLLRWYFRVFIWARFLVRCRASS